MSLDFLKGQTCAHTTPTFGCQGCIDQDREKAIRAFYFTKCRRPDCPDGHGPMMIAEGNRLTMTIDFACARGDCPEGEEVAVQ